MDFIKQNYAFHSTYIDIILKHCNAKVQQKLIKCCKQLFVYKPVVVVDELPKETSNIDLWVKKYVTVFKNFNQKIYKCEAIDIWFNDICLQINDLQLLSKKAKVVTILNSDVICANEKVTVSRILKICESVKYFKIWPHESNFIEIGNFNDILEHPKLEKIYVGNVDHSFDLNILIQTLYQNYIQMEFYFHLNSPDYEQELKWLVNFIIESEIKNLMIEYDGQDDDEYHEMRRLCPPYPY